MRSEEEQQAASEDERYVARIGLLEAVKGLRAAEAERGRALEISVRLALEASRRGDKGVRELARKHWRAVRERLTREVAAAQATEPNRIVMPPRLFFDGLLKRLMSPGAYDRYIKPVIADMHDEYYECLAKKDERSARWAVIRGHLNVVTSLVLSRLVRLLARVLGKVI